MADERPWRDPETLRRLYYEEGLTQAELADHLGCSSPTIRKWMRRHDIAPGKGVPAKGRARTLLEMEPDDVGDGRDTRA